MDKPIDDDSPIVRDVDRRICNSLICFVKSPVHGNIEDALPTGTGVLASIDGIEGVVTAAHVVTNFPSKGNIGAFSYAKNFSERAHRITFDVALIGRIVFGNEPFGLMGPDIAFLRLPPDTISTLKSIGSFVNLGAREKQIREKQLPSSKAFDVVAGNIAERKQEVAPQARGTRRMRFPGSVELGHSSEAEGAAYFDFLEFVPYHGPNSNIPASYQGTSGGGLWRVFCRKDGNGEWQLADLMLWGTAYYETRTANGEVAIKCHGPKSIYGRLVPEIRDKLKAQ